MTLKEYLDEEEIGFYEFADAIGYSVYAVRKWLSGERTPRDKAKVTIAKATKGKVKPQDWF